MEAPKFEGRKGTFPFPTPRGLDERSQSETSGPAGRGERGPGSAAEAEGAGEVKPRSERTPSASPDPLCGCRSRGPGGRRGRSCRPLGGRPAKLRGQAPTPPSAPRIPASPGPNRASLASCSCGIGSPRKPADREGPAAAPGARWRRFALTPNPVAPGLPNGLPLIGDTRLGAHRPPRASAPPGTPSASGHARKDPGRASRSPGAASVTRAQRRCPPRGAPPSFPPCLRATLGGEGSRPEAPAPARTNPLRRGEPRAPSLAAPGRSQLPPAPPAPRAAARPPWPLAGTCTLLSRLPFHPREVPLP
ncbi:basic salivary proline-rich protein 3-like [Lynx canadensis]|uniref:basic salivary proline-rich protein 3-like n=1 Tax=Lynx canadensis TaxID=61383 RepID=UPI0011AFF8DE|nr:basic salivary proline-rich protein 3-like [Lynx canadensis]